RDNQIRRKSSGPIAPPLPSALPSFNVLTLQPNTASIISMCFQPTNANVPTNEVRIGLAEDRCLQNAENNCRIQSVRAFGAGCCSSCHSSPREKCPLLPTQPSLDRIFGSVNRLKFHLAPVPASYRRLLSLALLVFRKECARL